MWFTRIPAAGARDLLAAVAALVWLTLLVLGWWSSQHPEAPAAFDVAAFVLGLVVLPFTVGGALAWRRHPAAHLVGMSSVAGVLAEWAFSLPGVLITTVTNFERQITFLSNPMNRLELLVGFGVFTLAGAVMGAAGGAVALRILRRRARAAPGSTPEPKAAAP